MRKQLLFIPHYIGSLKYFEKLIPHLENKYEVGFLFIPRKPKRLPEMINYCKEKNYNYFILEKYQKKHLKLLPFYHAIKSYYVYKKKCEDFLSSNNIARLIGIMDIDFYYGCLFDVANKLGIKTMILQWGFSAPLKIRKIAKQELRYKSIKVKNNRISSFIKDFYSFLLEIIKSVLGFKYDRINIMSGGNTKEFGVINQYSYNFFKDAGVPEQKMTVVGYIDFDTAKKTFETLNNNPGFKRKIAKKYNINLNKKNIIIYSSPFYIKDITILSPNQQLKHFYEIIKIVRKIFDKETTDILFKIHPVEKIDLYQPLKKIGVKLYDKNAINEELVALSDLYIGYFSTSNVIPIVMQKDCIFINLIEFKHMELLKEGYSIKKFISDKNEFKKLLIDFKNNKLVKQYTKDSVIDDGRCIERIIKWID